VECTACNDKQWYALSGNSSSINKEINVNKEISAKPNLMQRILIRLGDPQKAFRVNIPNPTQYFWFKCTGCGETVTDYPHGHARYLTCSLCEALTQFW